MDLNVDRRKLVGTSDGRLRDLAGELIVLH